jgi:putative ABC transport system permease protein
LIDNLLQDIRYGTRTLRKNPGFIVVAVVTLGLVLGANTAIFSIVENVLLRPLPYPQPEQLVEISSAYLPTLPKLAIAAGDFTDWKRQASTLSALEARSVISYGSNLTGDGEPQRVQTTYATSGLFAMLGIRAAAGRAFYPEEDKPGNAPIAMLSHELWQSRYGGDPGVVGRTITLDDQKYAITGVLPAGFQMFRKADLWMPYGQMPEDLSDHVHHRLTVYGRRKAEFSLAQVQAEFNELNHQEAIAYPAPHKNWTLNVEQLEDPAATNLRKTLLMLSGAVGLVLLIACTNIANLLLVRNAAREREFAVRTALGAGGWRLVRQLLTESVLISLSGGALGLMLAFGGLRLVGTLVPPSAAVLRRISMDGVVFVFAFCVCVLAGIICGVLPATQIFKTNVNAVLKQGGLGASGTGKQRVHKFLVVSEIAMALMPLLGAGLLLRSFQRVLEVDPGFRPDHLLTMEVQHAGVSATKFSQLPEEEQKKIAIQLSQKFDEILESVKSLPGVKAAGGIDVMPVNHGLAQAARFTVEGQPAPTDGAFAIAEMRTATTNYFSAVGIPLLRGRLLTKEDRGILNMVINETMAKRFWDDGDAVGKRVNLCPLDPEACWFTVVGIVGNVRQYGLDGTTSFDTYFAGGWTPHLLVRSATDPASLTAAVTQAVHKIDATLPIINITTMDGLISDSMSPRRFTATLTSVFAGLALLLATVGIYGVMSYSVSQRTQEIGIRMAMGAESKHVQSMILLQSMKMTLAGVAVGLTGAFLLVRFLSSLLFGVGEYDAITFMGVALLLMGVALAASYVPARRAVRVDPIVALRSE